MNLRIFVESLTISEINELSNILYDKKREYAKQNVRPLDWAERTLINHGYYIDAIKVHRFRTGSSLLEAKWAVDVYKEA